MKRFFICIVLGFCFIARYGASFAQAQEDHGHTDVGFVYDGDRIKIEFGPEGAVFEGEFPTMGVDRQFTTEPGFVSEVDEGGGLGAGDQLVYNVLGHLVYWNKEFQPVPSGSQVRIINKPPAPVVPDTIIHATSGLQLGSFAPARNRLGQAEGDGDFHSDLQFLLEPNDATGPVDEQLAGAYGVKLSLSSEASGIQDSAPFFVVFNFGLEEEVFEEGVRAFAASVPEPSSGSLAAIACLLVASRKRRRRAGRGRA